MGTSGGVYTATEEVGPKETFPKNSFDTCSTRQGPHRHSASTLDGQRSEESGWSFPQCFELSTRVFGYSVAVAFFVVPLVFFVAELPLSTVANDVSLSFASDFGPR